MARTSTVESDSHKLRKWRVKQGVTVTVVAEALGISQPFLHDIEMRNKRPSLDKVAEIAIYTGGAVDFADFLPSELSERYVRLRQRRSRQKRRKAPAQPETLATG